MRLIRLYPVLLMTVAALAASSAVSAMDTEAAIKQRIMETYSLDPEKTTIEITSNRLTTRFVDPDDLTLRAFSRREPSGPFTVYATIKHQGETIDRGEVRMKVNRFAEVLVATDVIKRHDLLTPEGFELKQVSITNLREQPVEDLSQIEGCWSTRNLRKGQILTTGAVEPIPDIEVGDEVTIVYDDGICAITVPGQVLETGWIGHSVRVKNKASGKIVQARVVNDQSVEIDP
jgi:flagella basal body P-ring formation protein FlgA